MTASPAGEIELLISDLDGTLVTSDKRVTPAAVEAVRRLHAARVAFTLISSRPPRGMAGPARALDVRLPMAAFNGGSLFGPDLQLLQALRLEPSVARHALGLLGDDKISIWVFAEDRWFLQDPHGPRIDREELAIGFGPTVTPSFEPVLGRIDKIVGVSDDHTLLRRLAAEMQEAIGADAAVEQSQPYYLDVTHPDANKGAGVRALCQRIGADPARTAVIGDMFNDVAMFGTAGLSIAMGQSPDGVKRMADRVAPSNDEDGFATAVERFVLPHAAAGAGR